MPERLKIALIGSGFSGSTESLALALRRAGCDVVHITPSLRQLRWRLYHVALMFMEALATHGRHFRGQVHRTIASNRAYAKAVDALLMNESGLAAAIQIGVNHAPYWSGRSKGLVYTAFTDHTNILSKKLPSCGVTFAEQAASAAWNKIEKQNLSLFDHVFVMGGHVKRSMIDDYSVPASRLTVIGAGPNVDLDIERDCVAKSYGKKNILFVGLDAKRKGLPLLLEAFGKMPTRHMDAILHVAGVDGISTSNIRYYGRLKGIALRDLFYNAQLFVMPTYREPFGIAFLEAMWAKTACIGTNIEAIPEIIEHGETGYVIEPGDGGALLKAIVDCLDHPELLEKMGVAAYRAAKERWSWDLASQRVLVEIERLTRFRHAP